MAHFLNNMSGGNGITSVDEEGRKFGLCGRGHDGLDDLGDGHDGSVVGWSGGISGHEKMSARSSPRLRF